MEIKKEKRKERKIDMEYININNLENDNIRYLKQILCPDCKTEYLKPSKRDTNKLLCGNCCLKIDKSELSPESKFIPEIGQLSKPYFNQISSRIHNNYANINTNKEQQQQQVAFIVPSSPLSYSDISNKKPYKIRTNSSSNSSRRHYYNIENIQKNIEKTITKMSKTAQITELNLS